MKSVLRCTLLLATILSTTLCEDATIQYLRAIFDKHDANKDSLLSPSEFGEILFETVDTRFPNGITRADISKGIIREDQFTEIDTNVDGYISPDEVKAAWTKHVKEVLLPQRDTNGDKFISFEEYLNN